MVPEPDPIATPQFKRQLRVMVVEDETVIALDLAMLIEGFGHLVVGTAKDFLSCQKIALRERPDVATMDMRLKGGDSGLDVAKWLWQELGIPSIFISGNLDEAAQAQLSPMKPVAFVGKPIMPYQLKDALAKACQRSS